MRKTTAIIGFLFGTILVMSGVGLMSIILVNERFAAAASGNMTNATNSTNPQAAVQKGPTLSNDVRTTTTNNNITLGNPFYIEHDKITSQAPVSLKGGGHAARIIFSGNGTVKGIGFTANGIALDFSISKTIVSSSGILAIKANDVGGNAKGNATLSFRQVIHLSPRGVMDQLGTSQGSGAAIFNANATGNLSFLSNTVGMLTTTGSNNNGTDTVKAWEWKSR